MSVKHTFIGAAVLFLGAASLLTVAEPAFAQVPKDIEDFTSHGIHVLLRNTNANQVVSAVAGFEGGLAYGETSNSVLSQATAAVMAESGSQKYPIEVYRDTLAKLSTTIGGNAGFYHTTMTLQTVRPNFDAAWDIFSDLLVHPTFDTNEAGKLRDQEETAIEGRSADPEGYTSFLLDSIWKGTSNLNHPATIPEVESLTLSDMQNYHNSQFQRSRMLLVVVGNVSRAELEGKLAALEALPMGSFKYTRLEPIQPVTGQFLYVPRELPTTYMEMRFPAPTPSQKDWWAERVMFQIMDKHLFDQVRTKRNLAYAPGSYATGAYSNYYGTISLQSIKPDEAGPVVFDVVKDLQNNLVPKQELEDAKAARITTYYFATQRNLAQANALYTDQVEMGDWRLFFQIVPETEKVTAEQVRDVARKYAHNWTFVLMGPQGASTQSVYKFQ